MPDPSRSGRMRATIDLGKDDMYTMSVVYGDKVYGNGPTHDTYEVAVFQHGHEDMLPLQASDDVLGYQNGEEITTLMKHLQSEPGFGEMLRVLKRTKYSRQFNNISQMRDQAFS
mgnify:CR=1 FL=1|jgi:hypothetical protein